MKANLLRWAFLLITFGVATVFASSSSSSGWYTLVQAPDIVQKSDQGFNAGDDLQEVNAYLITAHGAAITFSQFGGKTSSNLTHVLIGLDGAGYNTALQPTGLVSVPGATEQSITASNSGGFTVQPEQTLRVSILGTPNRDQNGIYVYAYLNLVESNNTGTDSVDYGKPVYFWVGKVNQATRNVSMRGMVKQGQNLIFGWVVDTGNRYRQQTYLIRAAGPSIVQYGVTTALKDPVVTVYDSSGQVVATNDNWDSSLSTTFVKVGAFPFPQGSKDAALLVNVKSGNYTVVVTSADGGDGDVLIEGYLVPSS